MVHLDLQVIRQMGFVARLDLEVQRDIRVLVVLVDGQASLVCPDKKVKMTAFYLLNFIY